MFFKSVPNVDDFLILFEKLHIISTLAGFTKMPCEGLDLYVAA